MEGVVMPGGVSGEMNRESELSQSEDSVEEQIGRELLHDPDFSEYGESAHGGESENEDEFDRSEVQTTFDISNQQVKDFPTLLKGLPESMEVLDAYGCQITEIPIELRRFTNLTHLYMSHNQISEIPSFLGDMKNLEVLDLTKNRLSKISPLIRNAANLRSLQLASNSLDSSAIASLSGISNLEYLDLSKNLIENISDELGELRSIRVLDLSMNSISRLSNEFGKLVELETLKSALTRSERFRTHFVG